MSPLSLNNYLSSQVVQSAIQLLQPLCSDPLYKHQLLRSPLPKAIQHLPCNNAIMVLLHVTALIT